MDCKFIFIMVFFLDNYILASFSDCFMKCEVSQTDDVKKNGNLRISRFYDITQETVPATDFGILRKRSIKNVRCWMTIFILFPFICINVFKLTTHKFHKILIA